MLFFNESDIAYTENTDWILTYIGRHEDLRICSYACSFPVPKYVWYDSQFAVHTGSHNLLLIA